MREMDWSGLMHGQMAGCCEHDNEPSGSTKCGELLEKQSASELHGVSS